MTPKVILPRPCPNCTAPFTPERRQLARTEPCCSDRCARQWAGKKRRGRLPVALVRGKLRAARARVRAVTQRRFGGLTAREMRLFNFAAKVGYDRGYNAGYHQRRREGKR